MSNKKSVTDAVDKAEHRRRSKKKLKQRLNITSGQRLFIFLSAIAITLISFLYAGLYNDRHDSKAAPGSLTVSINQKTGTPDANPSYTSVFTVQFNEAIDQTTFTNSDITLGGTAPGQAIQSITEAGTFNKTTYEVRIQATSTGTITPTIGQELISAQNGASGTNQASTSTDNSVTYSGDWVPGEYIIHVKTNAPGATNTNEFATSSVSGSVFNYSVDCNNDGTPEFTNVTVGSSTCTYGTPGEYDISYSGTIPAMSYVDGKKVKEVKQWGTNTWENAWYMFFNTSGLVISATDAPNFSSGATTTGMFNFASGFNSNINHWDTSNITGMAAMFKEAYTFNQPLNNWNVSNVTNMGDMFGHAYAFNQPLNNWDVSDVTDMSFMFSAANVFNQPLNNWNVSNVMNMGDMFGGGLSGLSTPNYDATLTAWSAQNLESGVIFDAGTSKYCNSEVQRQSIVTNFSWTINDAGKNCPLPEVTTEPATDVDQDSATLHGTTTPTGVTQRGFQYGLTMSYGSSAVDSTILPYRYLLKWGSYGIGDGQFLQPNAAITEDTLGNVYVLENSGRRVQKFSSTGTFITKWGSSGSGDGQFNGGGDITVDVDGYVYVADVGNSRVQKFSSTGTFITKWGSSGSGDGQFNGLAGIAVDASGNIFVADNYNNRVQKFSNTGAFITKWNLADFEDGQTRHISSLDIDIYGNIFVLNAGNFNGGNGWVQKFDSNGNFLTQWGSNGSGNGQFGFPDGIASDKDGNIFVADTDNHRVQKFSNTGTYLTQFGEGVGGYNDGYLATPRDITVSREGYVYVVDSANSRIQKFTGGITKELTGLTCNTTYHYRAYATNSMGTGYGNDQTFTTVACSEPDPNPFIMRVKTDNPGVSGNNQYTIPTNPGNYTYNYNVDCNHDGTNEYTNQTGDVTCTYGSAGEYDIAISGTFPHMYQSINGDQEKIIDIKQWGDIVWQDMSDMFKVASNITTFTATDTPNLSQVTSMQGMFNGAMDFNSDINNWDISNVVNTSYMFAGAITFNQPLSNWDTSNVVDMGGMFSQAFNFNQSLNSWDVSNVTDMHFMLDEMLYFNQPLNNWNVGNVVSMWRMFSDTNNFNQPLNSWDVSNVTDMREMFASINSFNQPLNNWDVSSVISMAGMFNGTPSFDQSLGDWDVSNVTDMSNMFGFGSGLSTPNYDATLIAWSTKNLESSTTLDAGTSKYCSSETQRQSIITNFNWTINDSGKDCTIPVGIPQSLIGTPHTASIEVGWDDVVGADHYKLEYKQSSESTWTEYTNNTITNSYLEISGITPDTSYDFRVKAVDNTNNESDWSNILTMSTLPQQTYHITNCQQLQSIYINPITYEVGDPNGIYILDNDIDCSETATWYWEGLSPEADVPSGFVGLILESGIFDGQNHTISNLYQNTEFMTTAGLFTSVSQGSIIKNTNIVNSNMIKGAKAAFNLYGASGSAVVNNINNSTIDNIHVSGLSMSGESSGATGGLVGVAQDSQIIRSSIEGSITMSSYNPNGRFSIPNDITTDSLGNVYVADSQNHRIQKFDSNGAYITDWSSNGNYNRNINSVTVDNADYIYSFDSDKNIVKYDSSGSIIMQFSANNGGSGTFGDVGKLVTDSSGNIYVTDTQNHRVKKYDSSGNFIIEWGSQGGGNGQFNIPSGIAIDSSNNVYVVDQTSGGRIQKFDSNGNYQLQINISVGGNTPSKIDLDSSGNIYVTYPAELITKKYSNAGNFISDITTSNDVFFPNGIDVSYDGSIYVTDVARNTVTKYDGSGVKIKTWGRYGSRDTSGWNFLGGLVSYAINSSIDQTYSDLAIIQNLYSADSVFGVSSNVAYTAYSTISNSYSKGSIEVNAQNSFVGGIIGFVAGGSSLLNTYSNVDITQSNMDFSSFLPPQGVMATAGSVVGTAMDDFVIENTFGVGKMNSNYPTGSIIGNYQYNSWDPSDQSLSVLQNSYFDQNKTTISNCIGFYIDDSFQQLPIPSSLDCHPVNTDGSQSNYFKNNNTNPPLNTWDFASIWKATCEYPIFTWQTACPSAPLSPSITEVTTSSMKLNWSPPADDGGSAITSYQVQYKASSSGTWINAPAQGPSPTSHVLTNLSPGTSYDFRVAAINAIGTSPYTSPVSATTLTPSTPSPSPSPSVTPSPSPSPTTTVTPPPDPNTPTTDTRTNTPVPGTPVYKPKPSATPTPQRVQDGNGSFTEKLRGYIGALGPSASYAPASLLILLVALAIFYLYQTWREQQVYTHLDKLLRRYRVSKQLRADFVNLSSHYLNTPLQIMRGSLELAQTALPHMAHEIKVIGASLEIMSHDTASLLQANQDSTEASASLVQLDKQDLPHLMRRTGVWLPVVSTVALMLIFEIVILVVGRMGLNPYTVGVFICLTIFAGLMVLFTYRARWRLRSLNKQAQATLGFERNIDSQRVSFMETTTKELNDQIDAMRLPAEKLLATGQVPTFANGYTMLGQVAAKLSQITTVGQVSAETALTPLKPWLESHLPVMTEYVESQGMKFNSKIEPNLAVNLTREALAQIVSSLIGNAVKFSKAGAEIRLTIAAQGDMIHLSVQDTGVGIAKDKLTQLMQPFARGTDVLAYDYEGIGLSLYLDRLITERVGGELTMQSVVGKGTTVSLLLPRAGK